MLAFIVPSAIPSLPPSTEQLQRRLSHCGNRCPLKACTPVQSARVREPRVCIEYCTGCRWGLRAGWMAQELLVTFEKELGEVALKPASVAGVYDIWIGERRIWCRKEQGRFPEMKEVKQLIRDIIVPDKTLGHSDISGE